MKPKWLAQKSGNSCEMHTPDLIVLFWMTVENNMCTQCWWAQLSLNVMYVQHIQTSFLMCILPCPHTSPTHHSYWYERQIKASKAQCHSLLQCAEHSSDRRLLWVRTICTTLYMSTGNITHTSFCLSFSVLLWTKYIYKNISQLLSRKILYCMSGYLDSFPYSERMCCSPLPYGDL